MIKSLLPRKFRCVARINDHCVLNGISWRFRTGSPKADIPERYDPACDPRFSYRGEDVVQSLERIYSVSGYPSTIRVNNGSELISRDLDLWAYVNGVVLDFSRLREPTGNGFIEAFNSKLRSECLNANWFMTLADAREKLETWLKHYNEDRPHSTIGYNVPIALHSPGGKASPAL